MVSFGYECDTCELSHLASFDCLEDAGWFLETWAAQGMQTWRVN